MKKEEIIKELEEDNRSDLEYFKSTGAEYEKLKKDWMKKDTEDFEIVGQVELRKQIIEKLNEL